MQHNKKILATLILFFSIYPLIFSLGAGVEIGITPSLRFDMQKEAAKPEFDYTGILTGTFRTERVPLIFSLGLNLGVLEDVFTYGIVGKIDYIFINTQFINNVSFLSGSGLSIETLLNTNSDFILMSGCRFFAGLSWTLYDGYLELYAQQCAEPKLQWGKNTSFKNFLVSFPFEFGVRFCF